MILFRCITYNGLIKIAADYMRRDHGEKDEKVLSDIST